MVNDRRLASVAYPCRDAVPGRASCHICHGTAAAPAC